MHSLMRLFTSFQNAVIDMIVLFIILFLLCNDIEKPRVIVFLADHMPPRMNFEETLLRHGHVTDHFMQVGGHFHGKQNSKIK